MCNWVDSSKWKAARAIFDMGKDIAMIVIAIASLLLGPGIYKDIRQTGDDAIAAKTISIGNRDTLAFNEKQISKGPAPQTESKNNENQPLSVYNIKYADIEEQNVQVESWLRNQYSGYPALVDKVKIVMSGKRFKGNTVPITIINATNLSLNGRKTSNPIIDAQEIDKEILKNALYISWREKNSGASSSIKNFDGAVKRQQ